MKWITITSPEFLSGEAIFIDKLFSQGLDLLHLRKPEASLEAYKQLLLQIPEQWHSRIVLHEHFELAEEYKLHGIHLNRRYSVAPNAYHGSISYSCHTIEEVITQKESKDYVFLSPIFDSISKVEFALLETNGSLSIIPKDQCVVELPDALICDGIIDEDNLKLLNRDINWLKKELKKQGVDKIEDVFYCVPEKGHLLVIKK